MSTSEDRIVRYLLFGNTSAECRGGVADLLASFAYEYEARAAFHQLREGGGWGEVVAVDRAGGVRRVCWFGERALSLRRKRIRASRWNRATREVTPTASRA